MRTVDIAQLSTRMFKTNPLRTWLTILGMGVGTGAVLILVGLGFGLQKIILEEIVFGEQLLSLDVSNPASGAVSLDSTTLRDLEAIENVLNVAPRVSYPALITYEGLTGNVFLQGIDPEYLSYAGVGASAGEVFEVGEDDNNNTEVLISQSVLKLFGIDEGDEDQIIGAEVEFRVLVADGEGDRVKEVSIPKAYTIKGISGSWKLLRAMEDTGPNKNNPLRD